jgi:hypothetical protein
MANPWFRLWTDMVNDPKFRTIARISKQEISRVISVYVHMMTCASNATERGHTEGWCDEDVATALDINTEDVLTIREAMQGRVLDGDYLTGWEKRQPLREREDDSAAERKRQQRAREANQANVTPSHATSHQEKPREEEIREEEKKEEKSKASCAEPQSDSTPAVVQIPLISGKGFGITESQAGEWQAAYPAVDVIRQLAAMRQWCLANPTKRKTARGVLAFCNSWLMREQDKPRVQPGAPPAAAPKPILPVEAQVPALAPMQRSGRPANFDSIKQGLKARESP